MQMSIPKRPIAKVDMVMGLAQMLIWLGGAGKKFICQRVSKVDTPGKSSSVKPVGVLTFEYPSWSYSFCNHPLAHQLSYKYQIGAA
jgi:hypothetical protein